MPPHLLALYRRVAYRAGGATLSVGWRCPALDGFAGRRGAMLLTACNPQGRRAAAGWNVRQMRRLEARLGRLAWLAGESGTGRWRERQFLVACGTARGLRLARMFRQNAALCVRRGQKVRLVVVRCGPG